MSETTPRGPQLLVLYEQYVDSRDTVGFVYTVKKRYTQGTLTRLATHPNHKLRCAAVLALGYLGDFKANSFLGRSLQDEHPAVRKLADLACRSVWNRAGCEEDRQRLVETVELNANGRYREATEKASVLLADFPEFAEAWYQRGSAWFQLDNFPQAIQDFRQALELNAYQFVAAAAMGDAYLRLDDRVSALDAFRRALRLNSDLARVRSHVVQLARELKDH